MSRINLNNYEAFLLDHLEGKLNVEDLAELKAFSLVHPELNIDLEQDALPYLNKETEKIDFNSDLLKKEEVEDEELISYLEGTLSLEKKVLFELKLEKDKVLQKLLHSYQRTKLKADTELVYEDKELLFAASDAALSADPLLNYFEGQLSTESRIAFEKELKSDRSLSVQLQMLTKTKLKADTTLVYLNKEELKKEAVVLAFFSTRRVVSMAAAILLIFGLIVLFTNLNRDTEKKTELLANKNVSFVKENAVNDATVSTNKVEEVLINANTKGISIVEQNNAFNTKKEKQLLPDSINKKEELEKLIVENKKEETSFPEALKKDTTSLAVEIKQEKEQITEPIYTKNVLLAYEKDDEEAISLQEEKPGFWKRAARFANQANKLGMKAVNGEENKGDGFLLSFNSLSIEKK